MAPLPRPRVRGGRRSSRQRQRTRTPFAYYLVAALAIASTTLSSKGLVKSVGVPLAVVTAAPFHPSSTRLGSIATLFESTKTKITSSVLYPPIIASTTSIPVVVPAAPLVKNGNDATLVHEGELKFETTRFLQSDEDSDTHDEADHEDHDEADHEDHDEADHEDHDDADHEDHDDADHDEDAVNVIQETQKEGENLPWGKVIGATFLVSLATLSGLLIIASVSAYRGILKLRGKLNAEGSNNEQSSVLRDICIFAFAAGALTATAVFLVLPEALHLIEG
jgi:hypothetical protein